MGAGLGPVGSSEDESVAAETVLLLDRLAVLLRAAGVDHAADIDQVADLTAGDVGAGLGDAADDLVAGTSGLTGSGPDVPST
ncbi:hypothetical protein RKD18_007841 [Streptomyces phaeoluteigriseus]